MMTLIEAEEKRQQEQARLDLAMGTAVRNRTGQYATPAALADDIVAFCWDYWKRRRRPVRFLEPCAGTGSFFSSLRRGFPAELIESALAYELDRGHAAVAKSLWHHAGLKSQATAHNVYLLLYPTGSLKAALEGEPGLYQKVFQELQAMDTDAIKGDGRVYGGGLFKMEPKELASIPAECVAGLTPLTEFAGLLRQEKLFSDF